MRQDARVSIAMMRRLPWADWRIVPVTAAVVGGPVITTVYRLTARAGESDGSLSLAQGVRGMLCFLMLFSLYFSRRLRLLEHRLMRPLLLLAGYATVTFAAAAQPYENVVFTMKVAFVMLVFANAYNLAQRRLCSEEWLLGGTWIVLIFMAISVFVGLLIGNRVAVYQSDYATAGLIDQPAVTAALTVSTLPVLLASFPNAWASIGGVLLVLVSLFFTMGRTCLVAALAAVLFLMLKHLYSLCYRMPSRRLVAAAVLLVGIGTVGLQSAAGGDLLARFQDLDPRVGSGSGRYAFWSVSVEYILSRSAFARTFGEGMGAIQEVLWQQWGSPISTHVDWLDFASAFGVLGVLAYAWWYFELARFACHLSRIGHRAVQGTLAALIVLSLISLGQGGVYDPSFALIYAALGFWAGQCAYAGRSGGIVAPAHPG